MKQIMTILLLCSLIPGAAGCLSAQPDDTVAVQAAYQTYRDIPGITDDEIAAIEALQNKYDSFSYGMIASTEAFISEDGTPGGYAALCCDWLTGLFGIPFKPVLYGPGEIYDELDSGSLDFTGNLMPTEERLARYYVTDTIAERKFITIRLKGSRALSEIEVPRYAFGRVSPVGRSLEQLLRPGSYEVIPAYDYMDAYDMLINDKADAYIATSIAESVFIGYDDIIIEDFFPLIFNPAVMGASKTRPELETVISVVNKALQAGENRYLLELYKQGYLDYQKHALSVQLTDEERGFIAAAGKIPVMAYTVNYPLSFYNRRDDEWQGIYFDLLSEISTLTGLEFEVGHSKDEPYLITRQRLYDGELAIVPELTSTEESEQYFIWSDVLILEDNYALISRADYRYITLNEIPHVKVGMAQGTAHARLFKQWFGNHTSIEEYPDIETAFTALQNGEVDMVMSTQRRLMYLTHYLEEVDYKTNVVFNHAIETRLVIHKDYTLLPGIIDKALRLISVEDVTSRWTQRTYDYRVKVAEAQMPWLIGAIILSCVVLVLVTVILYRHRKISVERAVLLETRAAKAKLYATEEQKRMLESIAQKEHEANQLKTRFLATMSHEIRTPMNAIIGMSELALREIGPNEHIRTIKQAASNLLAIINDILDFSKIEAGKLEIIPWDYSVSSLLNDVVSIIRMQVVDSNVCFSVKADSRIPASLYGDETRIRQAILNILNNAVKYTEKGSVTLGVYMETVNADTLNLIFKVTDTGIGIKSEDIDKLYSDFTQFDPENNKSIEGVGLGLAITYNIVKLMDGDITVKSTYGKGSTFTVTLPQKIHSNNPLAKVKSPGRKKIIIYKNKREYTDSITYAADSLGVSYDIAGNSIELREMMSGRSYSHLFIAHSYLRENEGTVLRYANEVKTVILAGFGETVPELAMEVLTMPIYCTHIADVLNGVQSGFSYNTDKESDARFTAPGARILLVDDVRTNLKVAQGLLAPYNMRIDICDGGLSAVKAVQSAGGGGEMYDLVLMDHKMPRVDGVEATRRIRALEGKEYQELPIVALTANAVSGMMEMFLENGFNDFLSKPIDTVLLNNILEKWIPKAKQVIK